ACSARRRPSAIGRKRRPGAQEHRPDCGCVARWRSRRPGARQRGVRRGDSRRRPAAHGRFRGVGAAARPWQKRTGADADRAQRCEGPRAWPQSGGRRLSRQAIRIDGTRSQGQGPAAPQCAWRRAPAALRRAGLRSRYPAFHPWRRIADPDLPRTSRSRSADCPSWPGDEQGTAGCASVRPRRRSQPRRHRNLRAPLAQEARRPAGGDRDLPRPRLSAGKPRCI
ncbi:Tricarboxylate transport transcriptional regulator TctD, partial [Pseudomonas fluorescens]